ncbi:MAG: type II toxin-antitoxin system Phd/YefM family antitoxin [Candidatus Wildermuthbacteria bacterium]|nr:type II toxin-antitoxin system Phd/YefM family antitoxin [Candidatus Wildermuthbacteria bacterium]
MDPKRTIPITEARKRIFEIINEVQKPDTYYTLTENGKPKAVILSVEEFESLWETIATLEEIPDLAKHIEEVEQDIQSGAYKNYPTLEKILAQEGFVVADKAIKNQRYGVHPRRTSQGRQKPRTASRKR